MGADHRPADADPDKNYCHCGCGKAIAWKRRDGVAKTYVNASHSVKHRRTKRGAGAAAEVSRSHPESEFQPVDLRNVTAESVTKMPDSLIYGMLRWYARGRAKFRDDQIQLLAGEARRRKMDQAEHWIKRIVSNTCVLCDKPAHYIVNQEGFCRDHAMTAGRAMRDRWGADREARVSGRYAEREARLKQQDAAARHHRARGRG